LFRSLFLLFCAVPQFDYHLPSLTVTETLKYQAKLRLPSGTSEQAITNRVTDVLKTLGLFQCCNIQVGNDEKKGISGGEKRRLSVGVQLLSDPSICLFDEPTTGLDAFTARHIVQTLKSLAIVNSASSSSSSSNYNTPLSPPPLSSSALRKRTVILSIHQPRYDIFACIDEVTLLSRGDMIWSGPVSEMLNHFSQLGFSCPKLSNPADFILDLSSLDVRVTLSFQSYFHLLFFVVFFHLLLSFEVVKENLRLDPL
jgi:ABC-type multidrug transport system ATPase subunit